VGAGPVRIATGRLRVIQDFGLRAAYEHIEDGIVVADADERIVYVNAAFESASGFRSGEVLGRTVAELLRPRAVEAESDVFVRSRRSHSSSKGSSPSSPS